MLFFYRVYEFLFSFSNPPPIIYRPFVLARYAINFVRASTAHSDVSSAVSSVAPVVPLPAFPFPVAQSLVASAFRRPSILLSHLLTSFTCLILYWYNTLATSFD